MIELTSTKITLDPVHDQDIIQYYEDDEGWVKIRDDELAIVYERKKSMSSKSAYIPSKNITDQYS